MTAVYTVRVLLLLWIFMPMVILAQERGRLETKGTILDTSKDQMKVLTKEGEKSFRIDSGTKGLKDIKEGSKVTVEYEKAGGEFRAKHVEPAGSIGVPCPCDKCPEVEGCKKERTPALRETQ